MFREESEKIKGLQMTRLQILLGNKLLPLTIHAVEVARHEHTKEHISYFKSTLLHSHPYAINPSSQRFTHQLLPSCLKQSVDFYCADPFSSQKKSWKRQVALEKEVRPQPVYQALSALPGLLFH